MSDDTYTAPWWRALTEGLRNDPIYIAEGIALDLGIAINNRLAGLGISRKDFARRLVVSQARVSQILRGHTNLTLLSICKAAMAVGLKPALSLSPSEQESAAPTGIAASQEFSTIASDACAPVYCTAAPPLFSAFVSHCSAVAAMSSQALPYAGRPLPDASTTQDPRVLPFLREAGGYGQKGAA